MSKNLSTNDITKNIWVSASAGSGKTKVLIDRFLRLLIEGVDPRKIVCITFTKAAASEMLERINEKLSQWSVCDEETLTTHLQELIGNLPSEIIKNRARKLLSHILDVQHSLQIKTIHSFCQTILNRFPIEANIEINTQLLEGSELEKIQTIAQKHTISEYSDTEFTKKIDLLLINTHDIKLSEIFAQQIFILSQDPNFFSDTSFLNNYIDILHQKFAIEKNYTPEAHSKVTMETIKKIVLYNESALQQFYEVHIIKELLLFSVSTEKKIENIYPYFFTTLGIARKKLINKKDSSEEVRNILSEIQNLLVELNNKKILYNTIQQTEGFLYLGHLFIGNYKKYKKSYQCLDYNDLINITLELLNNSEVKQWIQYKLHYRLEHLLIDEAQDTNLLQWQIIEELKNVFFQNITEKKCSMFVVGDPKQSIYSFQGTSPEIFEAMKFINMENKKNWLEVDLNTSYRSDQIILNLVDDVFNKLTEESSSLFYQSNIKHSAAKKFSTASVEIWPAILGKKREKQEEDAWKALTDYTYDVYDPAQTLAILLAKKVSSLLETGNFQPSDFLILVRKRDRLTQYIIQEFKKLHLPISGIDRLHFNSSLAIKDLISIAQFILLPHDNYNLACLLKSPIFNATEEEISKLATSDSEYIWDSINTLKKENSAYSAYADLLYKIISKKDLHKPFDLFITILDSWGYRKNFVKYFGYQINEVLDEFINICQQFQNTDLSLANFIQWFNNSDIEIKRDTLSSNEEIRLMTVHGSKGLQAKYVILPDTISVPINKNPIIFKPAENLFIYKTDPLQNTSPFCNDLIHEEQQKTLQEYYRLLYVALTRAEQHLLICGWTNRQSISDNSWFTSIEKILKQKNKIPADILMGYRNINIEQLDTTEEAQFFFSNSNYIYSIQKHNELLEQNDKTQEKKNNIELPEFLTKVITNKIIHKSKITPSSVNNNKQYTDNAILGTVLHKTLERFVSNDFADKTILKNYIKHNLHGDFNFKKIFNSVESVINSIIVPKIKNSEIKKEVKLHKCYNEKLYISATIDLLIIKGDKIIIVDYKTSIDHEVPQSVYQQMALYHDMISEVYQNKKIECLVISILTHKEFKLHNNILHEVLSNLKNQYLEPV